jgi:hypothetical protein
MRRSLLAVRSEKVRQQPRCPSAQSIEPGMQDFRGQATLTYFVERVITANDSLQNCDFGYFCISPRIGIFQHLVG